MKKYRFYKIVRPLIKSFMKVFFNIKIDGIENLPSENAVFAGNHTGYLDPLMIISSDKRVFRFLAKKELNESGFGFLFREMGTISVDRKGDTSISKEAAVRALNEGYSIVVFPEGTINRTEEDLLPFKKGAVHFAYQTGKLIVPFVIKGKYRLFSAVTIKYLKPFKVNEVNEDNEKLKNLIKKELNK